ncbi:MAG TPA: hypothetical protein VK105_20265 [Virgibacillus sp.]|nr:hypothetical protein [Virgibacillus sp.]HLR69428.1 hypothetical protein [Virgibacillus sp.]
MITNESIKDYLERMYGNDLFVELESPAKEKIIFNAHELLKDNFKEKDITDRAVALQVLFMLESDASDFSSLRNQGVSSYSVKGVSVSFGSSESETNSNNRNGLIAPAVLAILNKNSGAKVGRLI